ncbi:PREDICTED: uncharacterized protein LOC108375100 [Rhagoletis zephyria]|uniref:uncharacterized protein LOC108375100 n=1 Tax=Rhagoletis zephyria TaxID=28612 RepID=UPI0008116413|nr:PREDICTED: uncharacterized protein LOC108375100 [Rhagoletis zephyria]
MSFLDSVVVLRKTVSNLSSISTEAVVEENLLDSTLTEDNMLTLTPTTLPQLSTPISSSPSSSTPSRSNRRRRNRKHDKNAKFDEAIEAIVTSATKADADNVFINFGRTIAIQLEQLPLRQATEAMSEIHSIVTRKVLQNIESSEQEAHIVEPDLVQLALDEADISFY